MARSGPPLVPARTSAPPTRSSASSERAAAASRGASAGRPSRPRDADPESDDDVPGRRGAARWWTRLRAARADAAFERDALLAIDEQSPRGGSLMIWLTLLFVVVFVVWAMATRIEEVARGDGRVVPAGSVQVVHSLDGGVVQQILVREGQRVARGDPLVVVEPVRADSAAGETRSRRAALSAKLARLRAEADALAAPVFERPADMPEAAEAVALEAALFEARRRELATQLRVVDGQVSQREAESREQLERKRAAAQTLVLLQKEYDASSPLAKTGAVSEFDMVRLERDMVRSRGEIAGAEAAIQRLAAARAESLGRRAELEQTFRSKARQEHAEIAAELDRLRENARGLEDRVSKTQLRAPVAGLVKVVHARSVGGVVQPGKEVVEIVPTDDSLLVEVRIAPRDIARLRPGQPATVRITAFDYAVYGGFPGTLEHVGPDTVTDEKGNAFYVVRVRTKRSDVEAGGGRPLHILPGMTATVDVMTGERSVATYLLKPILRARQVAFTER